MLSTISKGLSVLLIALAAAIANAGELDSEKAITNEQVRLAADLPAAVVVRVSETTGEVAVLHAKTALSTELNAVEATVASPDFVTIDVQAGMTGELDRDSSRSSWYFCFNNYSWYYPTYYYYGYSYGYSQYYGYNWGGYRYYWYSWRY